MNLKIFDDCIKQSESFIKQETTRSGLVEMEWLEQKEIDDIKVWFEQDELFFSTRLTAKLSSSLISILVLLKNAKLFKSETDIKHYLTLLKPNIVFESWMEDIDAAVYVLSWCRYSTLPLLAESSSSESIPLPSESLLNYENFLKILACAGMKISDLLIQMKLFNLFSREDSKKSQENFEAVSKHAGTCTKTVLEGLQKLNNFGLLANDEFGQHNFQFMMSEEGKRADHFADVIISLYIQTQNQNLPNNSYIQLVPYETVKVLSEKLISNSAADNVSPVLASIKNTTETQIEPIPNYYSNDDDDDDSDDVFIIPESAVKSVTTSYSSLKEREYGSDPSKLNIIEIHQRNQYFPQVHQIDDTIETHPNDQSLSLSQPISQFKDGQNHTVMIYKLPLSQHELETHFSLIQKTLIAANHLKHPDLSCITNMLMQWSRIQHLANNGLFTGDEFNQKNMDTFLISVRTTGVLMHADIIQHVLDSVKPGFWKNATLMAETFEKCDQLGFFSEQTNFVAYVQHIIKNVGADAALYLSVCDEFSNRSQRGLSESQQIKENNEKIEILKKYDIRLALPATQLLFILQSAGLDKAFYLDYIISHYSGDLKNIIEALDVFAHHVPAPINHVKQFFSFIQDFINKTSLTPIAHVWVKFNQFKLNTPHNHEIIKKSNGEYAQCIVNAFKAFERYNSQCFREESRVKNSSKMQVFFDVMTKNGDGKNAEKVMDALLAMIDLNLNKRTNRKIIVKKAEEAHHIASALKVLGEMPKFITKKISLKNSLGICKTLTLDVHIKKKAQIFFDAITKNDALFTLDPLIVKDTLETLVKLKYLSLDTRANYDVIIKNAQNASFIMQAIETFQRWPDEHRIDFLIVNSRSLSVEEQKDHHFDIFANANKLFYEPDQIFFEWITQEGGEYAIGMVNILIALKKIGLDTPENRQIIFDVRLHAQSIAEAINRISESYPADTIAEKQAVFEWITQEGGEYAIGMVNILIALKKIGLDTPENRQIIFDVRLHAQSIAKAINRFSESYPADTVAEKQDFFKWITQEGGEYALGIMNMVIALKEISLDTPENRQIVFFCVNPLYAQSIADTINTISKSFSANNIVAEKQAIFERIININDSDDPKKIIKAIIQEHNLKLINAMQRAIIRSTLSYYFFEIKNLRSPMEIMKVCNFLLEDPNKPISEQDQNFFDEKDLNDCIKNFRACLTQPHKFNLGQYNTDPYEVTPEAIQAYIYLLINQQKEICSHQSAAKIQKCYRSHQGFFHSAAARQAQLDTTHSPSLIPHSEKLQAITP